MYYIHTVLLFEQTSSHVLKDLCDRVGVDNNGSTEDLINRLNEMVLFKEIYFKVFRQIQKCGGIKLHS